MARLSLGEKCWRFAMAARNCCAELLHRLRFEHRSDGLEDHHAGILGVPKIVGGGVRDESRLVVAIEIATIGKLHVHRADDSEWHALDAHDLADGGLAAKELLAKTSAKKNHTTAFGNIFRRDPPAVGWHFVAHLAIFGENATHSTVREALTVRDTLKTNRFPSDAPNQWRLRFHPFRVFFFEVDGLARSLAAGLLAGCAGPGNYRTFPKNFERVHQDAAKTGPVTQQ